MPTCFAEVFQDTRTIERSRQPWLVGLALTRDVALLQVASAALRFNYLVTARPETPSAI